MWFFWVGFAVASLGLQLLCVGYLLGQCRVLKAAVYDEERTPELAAVYGHVAKKRDMSVLLDSDDDAV